MIFVLAYPENKVFYMKIYTAKPETNTGTGMQHAHAQPNQTLI